MNVINSYIDPSLREYMEQRQALVDLEEKMRFSYGIVLNEDEKKASLKIKALCGEMANKSFNTTIHNYFRRFVT